MSSSWGWSPVRTQGIWRHGPLWLKPLALVSPWMTVVVCLMMMYVLGGTMTISGGVLFDLPAEDTSSDESTSLVAVILPLNNESTVFFDDARYLLNDGVACETLKRHIAERLDGLENSPMLVMADRRISGGDLSRFVAISRESGVRQLLFANRQAENAAPSRMTWQLNRGRPGDMRIKLFEESLPKAKSNPVTSGVVDIPPVSSSSVPYDPELAPPSMAAPPPVPIKREENDVSLPNAAFSMETMLEIDK